MPEKKRTGEAPLLPAKADSSSDVKRGPEHQEQTKAEWFAEVGVGMKLLLIACLPTLCFASPFPNAEHWGQWRGPLGNGVATHADPPLTWSEDKNVRWKTALPGSGNSSPVVWGDQIFLTATIPHGEEQNPPAGYRPGEHDNTLKVRKSMFVVIALDRKDGQILWQTTVRDQVPHEGHHLTGSYASASPITDGKKVFAFFGSHGLYCLDLKGKVLWEKDLGDMHTKHGHGEGSSPALHGETLVVNWDHEGPSFVATFNKDTGEERWRKERDEPSSWSSPHILLHEGSPQVVISAANRIRSYQLENGKLLWECGGLSHNVVASPVSEDGILIAGSSYEKQAILGIKLTGATGDITETKQVAWIKRRDNPLRPLSPPLQGPRLLPSSLPGGLNLPQHQIGRGDLCPRPFPQHSERLFLPRGREGPHLPHRPRWHNCHLHRRRFPQNSSAESSRRLFQCLTRPHWQGPHSSRKPVPLLPQRGKSLGINPVTHDHSDSCGH